MRAVVALIILVAGASAVGLADEQKAKSNNDIQKVINEIMNNAVQKVNAIQAEKQDEKVRFAAFKQFCEMTAKEKEEAIAEGTDAVEKLKADIGEANADAAQMAKDMGSLDGDISAWEVDRK